MSPGNRLQKIFDSHLENAETPQKNLAIAASPPNTTLYDAGARQLDRPNPNRPVGR
jgi:hypothetical protein